MREAISMQSETIEQRRRSSVRRALRTLTFLLGKLRADEGGNQHAISMQSGGRSPSCWGSCALMREAISMQSGGAHLLIGEAARAWRGRQALPPRLDSALNLGQHRWLECRLVPVGKERRGEHVHADAHRRLECRLVPVGKGKGRAVVSTCMLMLREPSAPARAPARTTAKAGTAAAQRSRACC